MEVKVISQMIHVTPSMVVRDMARIAHPLDLQRLVVVVVMHLSTWATAFAVQALDLATAQINIGVRAGTNALALFSRQLAVGRPVFAHMSIVTFRAPALIHSTARVFATFATDLHKSVPPKQWSLA